MRPHALTLTAFGPFAGTVSVDFDALSAGGLFLLHGDTGAGKSTLLDGLGFALYGRVPGERGAARRLRSDHAGAEVRTSVQLVATLSGRRLRITRAPEQQRAKLRGAGLTTQPASVLLEEWMGGAWTARSTRAGEADAELADLMGMSADQFFQVVLLPQGEFATFLRADSARRGEVLQRLFGTDRFTAVESWLAGRRLATAREVEELRQQVDVLLARTAQAAGLPAAGPDPGAALGATGAGPDEDPGGDVVAGVLEAAGRADADAARAVVVATDERDAARVAAAAAERLRERQLRRAAALAAQAQLDAAGPAVDRLAEELRAAGRAEGVAALLAAADERGQAWLAASRAEASARAQLPDPGQPLADVLAAVDRGRERAGRLDGLRDLAAGVQEEQAVAAAAAEEAAAGARDVESATALLAAAPAQLDRAGQRVASARAAAVRHPAALAEAAALASARDDAAALAAALQLVAELRERHLFARETLQSLKEKETELRVALVDSMVARLASCLAPDTPCPVCGSTSHPDPSELVGGAISQEDEERARLDAERAQADVEEIAGALQVQQAAVVAARQRLAVAGHEGTGLAALSGALAAATEDAQRAAMHAAELPAAEAALAALDTARAAAQARLAAAEQAQAAATRRAEEAAARAAAASLRLVAELGGAPDLAAAIAAAHAGVAAGTAVVAAATACDRAFAEALGASQAADRACVTAGFAGTAGASGAAASAAAAARAAARSASWCAEAQDRIRDHADAVAATAAALADPELAVELSPPADVEGSTSRVAQADVRLAQAHEAAATARATVLALAELVPQLEAARGLLAPAAERATAVRRLADLCAGTSTANALRMTLSSFVLAAQLEEVAAAASERLLRMTQGRYSLVHTDGAARGGSRSGLGLLARDTWTGQDRETSTLSGGETFLASLALALGLADVATAAAGGTRIEALFVDEGFGTLDEETLDEVMDVLDGLREGGRVVGLVSHVAELRARIPTQVKVRKTRSGSDLAVVGC